MSRQNGYLERSNYENDHRVRAGNRDDWFSSFDESRMMAEVIIFNDDEDEEVHELPCVYEICGTCHGKGSHVNPSIDSSGLSREDFEDDDHFMESYFSGAYDVSCYECRGKRVVPEIDHKNLTEAQKEVVKKLDEKLRADADYEDLCRSERMMGA